jgi:cell division protein FtsI (penicillin-binding protein 3)
MVGLLVVCTLAFAAVVVRLAQVQVLEPERYVARGAEQREVSKVIPAGRGMLLDREGVELALSVPRESIYADPALVTRPARTARLLAPILGLPRADLVDRLTRPGRFELLAHTVPDAVADKVRAVRLPGIASFDEYKRERPNGDVARSLLGKVSNDGTIGTAGLEEAYDDVLSGQEGRIAYERSRDGGTIVGGEQLVDPARPGADVVLTIDRALQYETEQALARHVTASGAKGGIAIISDPRTGEVLAMANVVADPDAEPGEPGVAPTGENLALTAVYEPGSVSKVLTLAASIEEGLADPGDTRVVPAGLQVADHLFTDNDPHPPELWTVTDILAASSNVGTIMLAKELGAEKVDAYLRRFGFGERTAIDFPDQTAGLMTDLEDWSGTSIGAIPIGQGVGVTAMQMLAAFNVIANDGTYVAPLLVSATVGTDGRRRPAPIPAPRRVVSPETARAVSAMMERVVTDGTGTKAAVPGYTVAGKTGTARKPLDEHMPGNGYMDLDGQYHYVSTFAGFVPAEQPALSIIVVLDEPDASRSIYASDVSAPAFAELAQAALRRFQVPPAVVTRDDPDAPPVSPSARGLGDADVPVSPNPPTTTAPSERT